MIRRRLLSELGREEEEMCWKKLGTIIKDGTTAEQSFVLGEEAQRIMILVSYEGSDALTGAWEILSVNSGARIGIMNSMPSVSGGLQVFEIQKTPFGFKFSGTKSTTPTFLGSNNQKYYNFIESDDTGISSFSFGSDAGKGASSNGGEWAVYCM